MNSSPNAATRGQRRGFYWQDWYAAWTMLRCVAEPAEGILAVEVEAADAPHVDDIVVHCRGLVVYQQLKHKVARDDRFTGSDLFGETDDGESLIRKLYKGWEKVRKRTGDAVEVHLVTNATGSSDRRNRPISPVAFERRILRPARDTSWSLVEDLKEVLRAIQVLTGAPDMATLMAFLGCLHVEFLAPDEEAVQREVVRLLGDQLRAASTAVVEADAWVAHVYDLATRHGETEPLSRDDIERELRRLFHHSRIAEHRLALPEHHVPRREVADRILEAARAQHEGYVVVMGPPGCGKTTLATWIANEHDDELLMRYHVFDPGRASGLERAGRASALQFVGTMLDVLSARFPDQVASRFPTEERLADAVGVVRDELARLADDHTRLVVVDGIDHVVRAGVTRQSLFDALPQPPPPGVVFVLFGQPDWDYPGWLQRMKRIDIPPFTRHETRAHVCQRLGWDPNSHSVAPVVDILHERSGGNPLSLFYNLALVETPGDDPDEVAVALPEASLFGNAPHAEYERLLDDLEPRLPAPQDSQSLRREMLACMAVAAVAVTEQRLANAFADEGLTRRQARDYLAGLRPVVVERSPGDFWLFHDDFRRYAEEQTCDEDRRGAHRRLSIALATDWKGDELASLAEHFWLGGDHENLATLPTERVLEEWFEAASPQAVVKVHRLALAAAFHRRDDIAIMRNALAAARASEAADLPWDSDESQRTELGLRGWSFVSPPRGLGAEAMDRRAAALHAAARGCRNDQALASEIAERFLLPEESIRSMDWRDAQEYVEAHTRWQLRSGSAAEVVERLDEDNQAGAVISALRQEFASETDPDMLGDWASILAGRNDALDLALAEAAFEHLVDDGDRAATRIARALLDCPDAAHVVQREAEVVLSLAEGNIHIQATSINAGVRWERHGVTNPFEWRDFFLDGYVTTASGSSLELSICEFPARFVDGKFQQRERSSDDLARFIWRVGCAAGLAMRHTGMLTTIELDGVVRPLIGEDVSNRELIQRYNLNRCGRVYLPLLARATQGSPSLSGRLRDLVVSAGRKYVAYPSQMLYGILEAVWVLAPDEWRSIAREAYHVAHLPGTEAGERSAWFGYWQSRASDRGAPAPKGFLGRAIASRIGVPAKSDPAELAVALVCEETNHPDVIPRLHRLTDLLIRLNAEPEGGYPARRHLPSVLALALSADPGMFAGEFLRCAVEHDLAGSFGSLPGKVTASWLRAERSVTVDELVALWHWVAASPGGFDHETSGAEALSLIADRLGDAGATAEADQVRQWLASLLPPARAQDHDDSDGVDTPIPTDLPTLRIEDASPAWFSHWWDHHRYHAFRKLLANGGEATWHDVCLRLSEVIAQPASTSTYDYLVIGDGIPTLRPSLSRTDAIELAMHNLHEKVKFQAEPEWGIKIYPNGRDRIDVLVGLLARGVDVADTETFRRTLRGLGALAKGAGTAPAIIREMQQRLESNDVRAVICALAVLRLCRSLPGDVLEQVKLLRRHPDAWCRWLACDLLDTEPDWDPPRPVLTTPGIISPRAEPTRTDVGAAYYEDVSSVRELYVRKICGLVDTDEDIVRSGLETELRTLPDVEKRPLGWTQRSGRRLTNSPVSDAARRLATRLATTIPPQVIPVLLSSVARFDPWLAFADPIVEPPSTWIEVCRAEVYTDREHEGFLLRSLGTTPQDSLREADHLGSEQMGEIACHFLFPAAPKEFAWVAESWTHLATPRMRQGPVVSLSFRNSLFTELERDRFDLVPAYWLPAFDDLRFEVADVPQWIHPDLGPVLMAFCGERTTDSVGIDHPRLNHWTGWAASPKWLSSLIKDPIRLIRFWRQESAPQRVRDEKTENTVEYGLEDLTEVVQGNTDSNRCDNTL